MLSLIKNGIETFKESLSENVNVIVSFREHADVACVCAFVTKFSAWIEQISLLKVKSPDRLHIIIKTDMKISFWVENNLVAGGLKLAHIFRSITVDAGAIYGSHCRCKSSVLCLWEIDHWIVWIYFNNVLRS